MDVKNEQISEKKFCRRLKKSAAETAKLMQKAYTDEECLGDLTMFHWHKVFSKGKETTALFPPVRQPLSICRGEMVNTVAAVVREDCHNTVRQFAQTLDISKSSVHMIQCKKLKMRSPSLRDSSFPDLRTERLPYCDLSRVAKKN